MAITIRDIDQHYYMIEDLKSLTGNKVTTKALIKGGYIAVELGEQLKLEQEAHEKTKKELEELKSLVAGYLNHQKALTDYLRRS
ncbi:hypothetical protein A3K86_03115 [Photobacterium jeanii]|uniref:Uncharacterized protein n=2 Tax=Photobacterium jeanii TaxID=858640 RepID=A0A178KMY5_9GAMM|nr:hypothetical protein A3K86_03115 [Photobacterium jeanii]PST92816.1 hypothetical protein C9I91_04335 [Photobacterium jeanii]